jgi:hypothetical protein
MTNKNIELFENNRLKYHWTLDQMSGNIAFDEISNKKAVVKNPFWLGQLHMNWKLEKSFSLKGFSQVVYNPKNDAINFVSPDSIITFNTDRLSFTDTLVFAKSVNLQGGMQLFYEPISDRLFCYSIDLKLISEFRKDEKNWDKEIPEIIAGTQYFHNNKFFEPATNSLYFFGGYGQLTYKKDIFRVNLKTLKRDTLTDKSNVFTPRYLFGLNILQLIHIADAVFFFDALNEEAMIIKCKILSKLGKHSLAKNTFLKFTKEYNTLYNEEYSKDFNEIVE